jgi:NAD(P)H-nitrite reductase large subunit
MVEFKTVAAAAESMKNSKYLIIGDGVAGSTAAEEIRRIDEEGSITSLTADSEPLYNRITVKTYMKGKMPKKFTRVHQKDWYEEKDIDLNLNTRVVNVDAEEKIVETDRGEEFGYEKLLVATGGKKRKLPEDGNFGNTYYMWNWKDADRIKESAEAINKAVVIGGGLLGIDLAVIYAEHGCNVDYLIRGSHWWHRGISKKGAEIVHEKLEKKGVNVVTDCAVEKIRGEDKAREVVGSNGRTYSCDSVGIAIGRNPNFDFIEAEKTENGSIKTDKFLKTSREYVYAAGDLVNYYSPVFERRREGGTWDHSTAMGKAAGRSMADEEEEFYFVPSYGVGHFRVQLLSIGENYGKSICRREGDNYIELFFEDNRLIGATMIGDVSSRDNITEAIEEKEEFGSKEHALKRFWKKY